MKNLLLVLCVIFAFGCKEEKVEKKSIKKEVIEELSELKLEMHYISSSTDKVQMLFALIELNNGKNAMFAIDDKIKQSNDKQVLKFSMFDDLVPFVVQIKFGKIPNRIIVDKIIIKYEGNEVYVDGKDIDRYFALNDNVKFDSKSGTLITSQENGGFLPHITLRRGYINKLFDLN
jgi:hypothetical protein